MENIEGAPNVQQWRRITSRLAEIEPSVVYKMPEFQPFDDKFKYPDFKYIGPTCKSFGGTVEVASTAS
jgi:hypothetical protein